MAVLAGVKNESVLLNALKRRGMSYYEAVAAKNIATKTSTFENERVNIFYSKASGAYTLVEK